jgi:hypothetical protein
MNTQLYDQWLEMNRAALGPMMRWSEIAAQSAEKCTRYSLAVAQDCLDVGARQMALIGELKDPQKWAAESSKLAGELGHKLMGRATEGLEVAKQTRAAFAALGAQVAEPK